MDNNLNDNDLNNEIIMFFEQYNGNIDMIDSISSIFDEIKNNIDIYNTENIDENNIYFNIEFEILQNNNEDENINYFKDCKSINEIIGKSQKIKNNDTIIEENCFICMEKYNINEYKRQLPLCKHYFHKKCIDKWLKRNASCPICRDKILP